MKRTLNGFIAGIALLVALLSTSINIFAWENNSVNEIGNHTSSIIEVENIFKSNFSINGNVKVKEGLDVILENIE